MRHRILPALLAALMAVSCASRRETAPTATGELSAREMTAAAEQLATAAAQPWQTLAVPASLRIDGTSLPRLSGTLTMVRDREIRFSIRIFGMEAGALAVTDDSIKGYVKLNRIYVAESIRDLLGGYPATVGNLQSLLLDRLFTIGDAAPVLKDATLTPSGRSGFSILPRVPAGQPSYSFTVSMPDPKVTSLLMSHSGRRAQVTYAGSEASDITLAIDAASGTRQLFGATVEVQCSRASSTLPDYATRPFTIPSGYRRISAAALTQTLGNL